MQQCYYSEDGNKIPAFYKTESFIIGLKVATRTSLSWATLIQSVISHTIYVIPTCIFSLSVSAFYPKLCVYLSPQLYNAARPAHLVFSLFHQPNNIKE
jgi:hypothetical protein